MVGKTSIIQNLTRIEKLYNKSTSPKTALFYSKLAILELCGWIEESMDDIVLRYANRTLKNHQNKTYVEKQIVKRIYGFDYQRDFRFMLMQVVGLNTLEIIEKRVDQTKIQLMESSLKTLKSSRDNEAHTYLKGVTRRLDAPSLIKSKFNKVYDGLKCIENELKRL